MISKDMMPNEDALLKAYTERVRQEIYDHIMADIKPKIEHYVRDAAFEAAQSLKTVLQERVDHLSRDMVVSMDLRFNGEKLTK